LLNDFYLSQLQTFWIWLCKLVKFFLTVLCRFCTWWIKLCAQDCSWHSNEQRNCFWASSHNHYVLKQHRMSSKAASRNKILVSIADFLMSFTQSKCILIKTDEIIRKTSVFTQASIDSDWFINRFQMTEKNQIIADFFFTQIFKW